MTLESLKRFFRPLMLWYCWKKGIGYKLTDVAFSPTFKCNLRCIMCPVWRMGERGNNPDFYKELSTDRILLLMNELKRLGTANLHFTGGEVLLRKDLLVIMKHARKQNLSFSMNTNGTLISKHFAEKLVETGIQKVVFSIDSANPKVHDKIRGKSHAWDETIKGMINVDLARKKLGSRVKIMINSVLMSLNYETIDEVLDLKEIVDFDELTFSPIVDPNRTPMVAHIWTKEELEQHLELTMEEIEHYTRTIAPEVYDKAKKYGFLVDPIKLAYPFGKTREEIMKFVELGRSIDLYHKIFCFKPWFGMEIYPNGNIAPCCAAFPFGERYIMGNLRNDSLLRIWNGEKYVMFRRQCKPPTFPMCKFCSIPDKKTNLEFMEKYQRIQNVRTVFSTLRK